MRSAGVSYPKVMGTLVLALGLLGGSRADAGSLWLGNDGGGTTFHVDTTGAVLGSLPGVPSTGLAFDGSTLYLSNFPGGITERTADGTVILDSFFIAHEAGVCCGEDLAWDTSRDRLWRIDHSNPGAGIPSKLRRIDPVTNLLETSFDLPLVVGDFANMGGLGLAYDPIRDLLYASFCHAGCATLLEGIVIAVDPDTGGMVGPPLFTTSGFATGGLGYDPATDTLWVGDNTVVRNMELDGTVLSSFARPGPGGFVDGLEFIAPEPGSLILFGSGLLTFGLFDRRRRKHRA